MKKTILYVFAALVLLIQLIPLSRTNPPVTSDITAAPQIKEILKRSCYDCHSHETVWPWYSKIAPVSWLVGHDVKEGRSHLNFSTWGQYDESRKQRKLAEIGEEIQEDKMPLGIYLVMHRDARLSEADLTLIRGWLRENAGQSSNQEDDRWSRSKKEKEGKAEKD